MIKKLLLKNFKGISDPGIEIDLKPITLLFGPNSGGKSTILHSILYAKEIFERNNYNPVTSSIDGSNTNLGGFNNFVNNNDLTKSIQLGFQLNMERESPEPQSIAELGEVKTVNSLPLEDNYNLDDFANFVEPVWSMLDKVKSAMLILIVKWNRQTSAPIGTEYQIWVQDSLLFTISLSRSADSNNYYHISDINLKHEILINYFGLENLQSFETLISLYKEKNQIELHNYVNPFPHKSENFKFSEAFKDYLRDYDQVGGDCHKFLILLGAVLNHLHFTLREDLEKFRYIGPIRRIPERNFVPHLSHEKNRWADGMAAWDAIYNKHILPQLMNKWMSHLKLDYQIEVEDVKELSHKNSIQIQNLIGRHEDSLELQAKVFYELISDSPEMAQNAFFDFYKKISSSELKREINVIFELLPNELKVSLVDQNTNVHLQPFDVGVGLSQVIPVLVGVLERRYSIFSVEQPELHIHPSVQVELADLFIDQVNRSADSIFLIETHSEHIILRMLRRIESSTKKILTLSEVDKKNIRKLYKSSDDTFLYLNPEMINVFWCEQSALGQKIELMPIDETGEFTRQWPKGFFEEREGELFYND